MAEGDVFNVTDTVKVRLHGDGRRKGVIVEIDHNDARKPLYKVRFPHGAVAWLDDYEIDHEDAVTRLGKLA